MKRFGKLIGCLLIVGVLFGVMNVSASDDNIAYSFSVNAFLGESRSPYGRYRQTTNVNNKWKVNLRSTTEGSGNGNGNITTFYLGNYDWGKASADINAPQGSGNHYLSAFSNASQSTVYLTAINNNYSISSYNISGYWDEETN